MALTYLAIVLGHCDLAYQVVRLLLRASYLEFLLRELKNFLYHYA